jgi:predicted nucleic acid-binding protein
MQKSPLVAVDTNFPLSLAEGNDDARDALEIVRERVRPAQILVPPTALAELIYQSQHESNFQQRELAGMALLNLRSEWRMQPATLQPEDTLRALAAARQLLLKDVLPRQEWNDAKIIAEAAALSSTLLVSNDSHLLEVDHRWLVLIFREHQLPVPLIASPRQLVQKFYRR